MTLSFQLDCNMDSAFEYLSNMELFASAHPVISAIDDKSNSQYLVHETLKFGFLPFSFTYPVSIEHSFEKKEIQMNATVMKLVKVKMNFALREEKEMTLVKEQINFSTILPIKSMLKKTFKEQHALLFENIESMVKESNN